MKRKFRLISLLLLCTVLTFSAVTLSSCNEPTRIKVKNRMFYEYFDTISLVYDYTGGSQEEFDAVCKLVEDELSICHKLFDIYNSYDGLNNIKTVNDNAGGDPISVDTRIIDLLEFSVEMYGLTDGNVNVAMGSVLSLWHKLREEGKRIPTEAELAMAGAHISIDSLEIDRSAGTVRITDPSVSLDVGAVAKGFTAERIAAMLADRGVSGYALDFGGNLRVIGTKPDGSGWTSGIRNPDLTSENATVRTVTISDSSLVTSGVYERFYTVGGIRYHHIINSITLMPENNYLSVTVHTRSSAVADALSTALFNMSIDGAQSVIDRMGCAEVTFVMNDGTVRVISSN